MLSCSLKLIFLFLAGGMSLRVTDDDAFEQWATGDVVGCLEKKTNKRDQYEIELIKDLVEVASLHDCELYCIGSRTCRWVLSMWIVFTVDVKKARMIIN